MTAEKHKALAEKIVHEFCERIHFHKEQYLVYRAIESYAQALADVEREAKEYVEMEIETAYQRGIKEGNVGKQETGSYFEAVGYMKSVKGDDDYCMFVNENANGHVGGFKWEFLDFEPKKKEEYKQIFIHLHSAKDIVDKAYEQGKASQVALRIEGPDKKQIENRALNYFYEQGGTAGAHGATGHFKDGVKWCIKNLRQTECELVLPIKWKYSAHLYGEEDIAYENGVVAGQHKTLDAIKKLNPHLKTRVEGE